jgi:hypothetical protein
MPQNPPNVNGVATLTTTQTNTVRNKLITIRDNFVPTDEQPVCDTFYITSTYNAGNTLKINGDTAESLLYSAPTIEPTEGE